MLVLPFCLIMASFSFTHVRAATDLFSEPDALLFFSLDDQDLQPNGDLMQGFSLNSQDLVPSLSAQDLNSSENFEEALSTCPDDHDTPSKKLKARNSDCPNVPSGPINVPDLTNLLNSISVDELPNDKDDDSIQTLSDALEVFCTERATSRLMIILVCGSVTYPDGAGQRPGFFTIVRNSWIVTFPGLQSCSFWDYFCCEYWDPDVAPMGGLIRGTGYNCESVAQRTFYLYPSLFPY